MLGMPVSPTNREREEKHHSKSLGSGYKSGQILLRQNGMADGVSKGFTGTIAA
jgi:hypothetical protein